MAIGLKVFFLGFQKRTCSFSLNNFFKILYLSLHDESVDICVMQEIDVLPGYDRNLLAFKGFNIEIENNKFKARTGIYSEPSEFVCYVINKN